MGLPLSPTSPRPIQFGRGFFVENDMRTFFIWAMLALACPTAAKAIEDDVRYGGYSSLPVAAQFWRSGSKSSLDRAKHYLGTNPTGWAHVWCGRFMRMIVPSDPGQNFNLARSWATYGRPAPGAVPGSIAVLTRGRGGHVGIVVGNNGDGTVRLLSGNHGRTVGIGDYSMRRVIAFRLPS